jgi:hypothetical protein
MATAPVEPGAGIRAHPEIRDFKSRRFSGCEGVPWGHE